MNNSKKNLFSKKEIAIDYLIKKSSKLVIS